MRKAALCVLVALAFGCTGEKPAPEPVDAGPVGPPEIPEQEPNDRASSAMPLPGSVIVQSALSPENGRADDDHYRLDASPGNAATVSVSGIPGVDLAMELLDVDGNRIASFNSAPEGKGERIPELGLERAAVVRVFSPKKGSGGAYTFTVDVHPQREGFEVEPNERPVDATPLILGESIQGFLADRADEDWFSFELGGEEDEIAPEESIAPDGSVGEADEDQASPEPDAALADAGPEPAPLPDDADEPAAPPSEPELGAPAEEHAPESAPDEPSADQLPEPESTESTDASTAPTAAAEPPRPAIPPLPTPPALVRIDVEGVPGVRLQVELANQAEAVFYSARSRAPGEGISVRNVALRPNETRYFVIVRSAWIGSGKDVTREYNQEAPYRLRVALEEANGSVELEPNDDPDKATPLVGDGVRQGFFAPKGDVDYFLVRYEEPSLVKVELGGVDRIDSVLSVVRPASPERKKEETLLRANDGGAREGELLTNLAVGPEGILLKVEAAARQVDKKWVRDQENAIEPYRLTLTSRPDDGSVEREPNDQPELATPVTLGQPIRGTIHPRKDLDLYRIELSASPVKVPLRATVTGILKVDVAAELYRLGDDGKLQVLQIADRAKGDETEVLTHTVEPGVYYLGVRDTRNREANFVDSYQLRVERND